MLHPGPDWTAAIPWRGHERNDPAVTSAGCALKAQAVLAAARELSMVLLFLFRVGIGAKVLGGAAEALIVDGGEPFGQHHALGLGCRHSRGRAGARCHGVGVCTGSAEALVGVDSDGSPEV